MDDTVLLYDVFDAYYDARRNKRNTKSQLAFEMNLEHNLLQLYEELRTRTYKPSPCTCFITFDPVQREIFASSFKDRVVHHLLFNNIAHLFEKTFIHDSYSCREERGTFMGIERFEHHLRSCTQNYKFNAYVLKLDIKGYFMSIPKLKLRELLRTTMDKNKKWEEWIDRGFIDYLIDSILMRDPTSNVCLIGDRKEWEGLPPSKSLFKSVAGTGLPIGDLTSQLFSNIYLNQLDQFAKRELGLKHYGRYVDDFYVIDTDRRKLLNLVPVFDHYLREKLSLTLHPKKVVLQHSSKGVLFLGAYIMPYSRYPRWRTIKKFRYKMKQIERFCEQRESLSTKQKVKIRSVINSYCGYLSHFATFRLRKLAVNRSAFYRHFFFYKDFKQSGIKGKSRHPAAYINKMAALRIEKYEAERIEHKGIIIG